MTLLAVSDAAERLGVSTRQVQHLVARGELRKLARGVVDEASVERLRTVRAGSHTRAWSEATAWGAVAQLSDVTPTWVGESQQSRLKARLRKLTGAELVERARGRAHVTRYSGHPSTAARLHDELVDTMRAGASLGLADVNAVDGYTSHTDVADLVARHGLVLDDQGRLSIRATTMALDTVADIAERSTVLAALDLAESLDVRERRAGLDALEQALGRLRD